MDGGREGWIGYWIFEAKLLMYRWRMRELDGWTEK